MKHKPAKDRKEAKPTHEAVHSRSVPHRGKLSAFAGFQPLPGNPVVQTERVMVADARGKVIKHWQDVSPISDFVGTSDERTIKTLLQRRFQELFQLKVNTEDIHFVPFAEVDRALFKRENV